MAAASVMPSKHLVLAAATVAAGIAAVILQSRYLSVPKVLGFDADADMGLETSCEESMAPEFHALAVSMPPTVRRILVDGCDKVDFDVLIAELRSIAVAPLPSLAHATILSRQAALSMVACAALRNAVDQERSKSSDTVDGGAEHQLNLSLAALRSLVGEAATCALGALPVAFQESEGCIADNELVLKEIFVRRYTCNTRPWNPFHNDLFKLTVNVALADDAAHSGGKLLAIQDDQLRSITRKEGEATVHDSRLLHAVTRITCVHPSETGKPLFAHTCPVHAKYPLCTTPSYSMQGRGALFADPLLRFQA